MKLATLCYVRRPGYTLMMRRVKKAGDIHYGKWNGLGGKFLPGESPEDCAIREVHEESNLRIENPHLHGVLTFPLFDGKDDWYVFVFTADKFSGELGQCEEGELAWIENTTLLDLNLWEGDRIFLPWLDQPAFFSGKFTYLEGKLVHEVHTLYATSQRL